LLKEVFTRLNTAKKEDWFQKKRNSSKGDRKSVEYNVIETRAGLLIKDRIVDEAEAINVEYFF
jgi:hypothetical protein